MLFTFNGKTTAVPSVQALIEVIGNVGAELPAFDRVLFVGQSKFMTPLLAHDSSTYSTGEADPDDSRYVSDIATLYADLADVKKDAGFQSEIAKAFEYFKKMGGSSAWIMNADKPTRCGATLTIADPATNCIDIHSKGFGAHQNDIYMTLTNTAGSVSIELTKPRYVFYLSAETGSSNYYVEVECASKSDLSVFSEGDTIHIGADGTDHSTWVTRTIDSIDTDNKRIYFTATIGSAYSPTSYARIMKMHLTDTIDTVVGTPADNGPITPDYTTNTDLTTDIQIVNWLNETGLIGAEINEGGIPETVEGFIGDITSATEATAAVAGYNWSTHESYITEFCRSAKIRHIVVVNDMDETSSAEDNNRSWLTNWQNIETDLRTGTPPNPVLIWFGCNRGDTSKAASVDDSPETRASGINNQYMQITDVGFDGMAAYMTYTPEVVGKLTTSQINHNLTRDKLLYSTIEDERIEHDTEIGPRILKGVLTTETKEEGSYIARGVNTNQDNATLWTEDSTTHSIMQRQCADYAFVTFYNALDNLIGLDDLDETQIRAVISASAAALIQEGVVTEYNERNLIISRESSAWDVTIPVKIDEETDWIGLTVQIIAD